METESHREQSNETLRREVIKKASEANPFDAPLPEANPFDAPLPETRRAIKTTETPVVPLSPKIVLPKYASNYNLCPFTDESELSEYGFTFVPYKDSRYTIYWGINTTGLHVHKKFGVMESGFFNEAAFIDTVGAYQCSSLNMKSGYDCISNFDLNGRRSAKDIVFSLAANKQSKYNAAHGSSDSFDQPIILACQNPSDRSIGYPHSQSVYMQFVEDCCKFYGKDLFLKLHPWNSGEKATAFIEIAEKYNCGVGKFNMSLIKGKEFVIGFNTTMVVDCILRDVPVVQYAMGTFWNCFGVHFSNYTFPTKVDPIPNADNLANFLIHKYCYNKDTMGQEKYAEMIRHYASSTDIFPMIDKFSYASNCV